MIVRPIVRVLGAAAVALFALAHGSQAQQRPPQPQAEALGGNGAWDGFPTGVDSVPLPTTLHTGGTMAVWVHKGNTVPIYYDIYTDSGTVHWEP